VANDFSLDADCMALFNFESGALITDSKGGNILTNSGVGEELVDFKQGSCCAVFAPNDYMYRTDADLDPNFPLKNGDTNKKISVTFWVKFTAYESYNVVCGKWNSGAGKRSFMALAYNAGVYRFGLGIGYNGGATTELIFDTTVVVGTNKWYHVGITFQDSDKSFRIRIYDLNADLTTETTGNSTNNINIEDADFEVGRWTAGGYMRGQLDELVVFKDILSAAEIDQIRQGIYTVAPPAVTAKVVDITYLTPTSGYIWYVELSGENYEDDDVLDNGGGDEITVNGTPAADPAFYEMGEVEMTSGLNNGQQRPVALDSAGTITVLWPFVNAVAMNDTYKLYPGCDLRGITCHHRFHNEDVFRGFLYVPRIEDAIM